MYLIEIGKTLRTLRQEAGYSQQALAQLAGVARETVSRIENGTYNDLGVKKLIALLALVGGELRVERLAPSGRADFVRRAVTSANVSHKRPLHADELIQALVTGQVPPGKEGHLRVVLEELSGATQTGLLEQVGRMAQAPEKVRGAKRALRARLG